MFWRKKVFDLNWALGVEALAPIPVDHAVTVMAVLESGGVPVTAGTEAAEKIAELEGSVGVMEDDLRHVKRELDAAPDRTALAISALRRELDNMVKAAREAVRLRTERMNHVRNVIVAWVDGLTDRMTDRAFARNRNRIDKLGVKFSARIDQAEANLWTELASLRDAVSQLEAESFAVRAEVAKLDPIATKWTLSLRK